MCTANKICCGSFCVLPWDMSKCVSSWAGHTSNLALSNVSSAVKFTAANKTVCIGSSWLWPEALHQAELLSPLLLTQGLLA